MALNDWLNLIMNNKERHVQKLSETSIEIGEMASSQPVAAAASIKRMMDQKNGRPKLLMVGDGIYSKKFRDYSLKMAKQLNCEIVALCRCKTKSLSSCEKPSRNAKNLSCGSMSNIEQFIGQSESAGVKITFIIQFGDEEKMITELLNQDPTIRYMLRKPAYVKKQGGTEGPIFNLEALFAVK